MKSFKDFQEQLVAGQATPSTPAQTQQQRATSAKRASVITRRMKNRAEDELSAHQSNMRTLLRKDGGTDVRGGH